MKHLGAAGQLQDVQGFFLVGLADNGRGRADLAHGEGHVGVAHVVVQGHDHGRPVHPQPTVGVRVVVVAHGHGVALVVEVGGRLGVRAHQQTGVAVLAGLLVEIKRRRVVADHDDVVARAHGQLARGQGSSLGLQPGGVEELDEGERQHDQQKDDAGQQHDDGKQPSQVAGEGDVAKAQGRHDGERPIKARDPGIFLAVALHDPVEHHGIQHHHGHKRQDEIDQKPQVTARGAVLQQIADLGGEKLHGASPR